ncbi:hypothetical protein [Trueperella pyogenes]|uniref:hypothetical protein n=1 Tax=Trueperella pyogenes TaxID=1661 RepID=UPI00324A4989
MATKMSQKALDATTKDLFADEIGCLERKRVATQEIIKLIETIEPLHSELCERRDELISLGVSRARLIKMLDVSALSEKVLRAKPDDLVRRSRRGEEQNEKQESVSHEETHEGTGSESVDEHHEY